jgi:hypothetical protein
VGSGTSWKIVEIAMRIRYYEAAVGKTLLDHSIGAFVKFSRL